MIPLELIVPRPASLGGVILAGGAARRMGGGDKGEILIGGRSILDRQIAALAPQVAALALSANGPADRFASYRLPVLPDPAEAEGPLAGLLAGLDWAAAMGFTRLLSVPCDLPFLPRDLAMRLGQDGAAIAASDGRTHPVIGLWPVTLRDDLRRFVFVEGGCRVGDWAERSGAALVEWPDDPFVNVNRPDDRLLAEALAASPAPRRAGAVVLPPGETAQTLLEQFAAELRAGGVRVGGLIQRGRRNEAALVALDSGECLPIMQKLGRGGSACAVDHGAVTGASAVVRRAIARQDDLVVVNKFGPLEVDHLGLADEMMTAMAEGLCLLTTVTLDRVEAWLAFSGGWCELIPADLDALRRWWRG